MENKIQSQMRKGILDFLILAILQKNGETYGAEIIEILKKSDLIVVEGTVYPLLTRLKKENFLDYRWEESESGHPRKYFTITPSGEIIYRLMEQSWQELSSSAQKILSSDF